MTAMTSKQTRWFAVGALSGDGSGAKDIERGMAERTGHRARIAQMAREPSGINPGNQRDVVALEEGFQRLSRPPV